MSELDRALDAALRDMVAGDGPPDLRQRVLARIDERARGPAGPRLALAAAAGIAVAVASVALLRTAPGREPVMPSDHPSRPALSAARPAQSPAPPVVTRMKPAPSGPVQRRPRTRVSPQADGLSLDLDAGMDMEPIELAPLAVVPISGEHIASVTALTIERMDIEPLADPQP